MDLPLTQAEGRRIQEDQVKEEIVKERFCRMRPDGITVLPPMGNKSGVFFILEHKRMSDVYDSYLTRVKLTVENQYASLLRVISEVIHRQDWKVEQISFITGARSVNKQDLQKNLKFFQVPEASIQSIYSKLTTRVFDVYSNILKCIYSVRFNGGSTRSKTSPESQSTPTVVTPSFVPLTPPVRIDIKDEEKSIRRRKIIRLIYITYRTT